MVAVSSVFPVEPTQPYLTPEKLRIAPMSRNLQHFFPASATDAETYEELERIILRASAEVNTYCNQPLHAHTDVGAGRVPVDRWGRIMINPRHDPVTTLISVQAGRGPSDLATLDLSDAEVSPHRFVIPRGSANLVGRHVIYAKWTYTAGYDLDKIPEDIIQATILLIDANLEFADTYALTVTRDDRGGLSNGARRKEMIDAAHKKLDDYVKLP